MFTVPVKLAVPIVLNDVNVPSTDAPDDDPLKIPCKECQVLSDIVAKPVADPAYIRIWLVAELLPIIISPLNKSPNDVKLPVLMSIVDTVKGCAELAEIDKNVVLPLNNIHDTEFEPHPTKRSCGWSPAVA
jgi:hypothetical protein